MLAGSVISKENKPRLAKAQRLLAEIKDYKLTKRRNKHENEGIWNFTAVVDHLDSELAELHEAVTLNQGNLNILDELADIANIADILTMMIIDGDVS